jgi:uncharacterized membrane protein required for colicin V production
VVISFAQGMRRGLIFSLSGLVGIGAGIWCAARFSCFVEDFVRPYVENNYAGIVAFGLTVIAVVIGVHFLATFINGLVKHTILSVPNRLCGGVFYVAKSLFIISCVLYIFTYFNFDVRKALDDGKKESVTYLPLLDLAPSVYPYLNSQIRKYID